MKEDKLRKQAQQLINKKLFSIGRMANELDISKPSLMKLRTLNSDISMNIVLDTIEKLKEMK